MEKQVKRNEVYNGKIIHVVCDDVEIDDGTFSKREVVYHNGGACIALKDKDGKFFLVKQFRYALETDMIEFCAGKIEKGENSDDAILRECEEELGYKPVNVHKFGYIVLTCGYCSEKIYLYYGEVGEQVGTHFDKDERITSLKLSASEIKEMIRSGEINDGKTVALMMHMELAGLNDQS